MSIALIRNVSRLTIARSACIQALMKEKSSRGREILKKSYEIQPITLKYRFFCSDVDLTKIATYEQVKDLPNHPEKLLIDVREPHELVETGVIPTSINIPLKQVPEMLTASNDEFKKLFNREKPSASSEIIFHCRIGMRSETAAEICRQLGYKNVKNYKGSWLEWAEKENLK